MMESVIGIIGEDFAYYLMPLFLTILIELGYCRLVYPEISKGLVVGINFITNPPLNYLLGIFISTASSRLHETGYKNYADLFFAPRKSALVYWLIFLCLEYAVVLAEAHILKKAYPGHGRKMFLLSLGMNAASCLIGILLWRLLP